MEAEQGLKIARAQPASRRHLYRCGLLNNLPATLQRKRRWPTASQIAKGVSPALIAGASTVPMEIAIQLPLREAVAVAQRAAIALLALSLAAWSATAQDPALAHSVAISHGRQTD